MLFASLLLSTKTNPDDVSVCYTLIKKKCFEINIVDGLDDWEAWFLIRTKVTSELITRSNLETKISQGHQLYQFQIKLYFDQTKTSSGFVLVLKSSKGKSILHRSYFMTGIMRHRETCYKLLHAKITKYVDLLLFIIIFFDSFS